MQDICDDWFIDVETKNQYKKCIKIMHNLIKKLKFKLAIDKTFIGKIASGFGYLGQRFDGSDVNNSNQQINVILTIKTHITAL